MARGSGVARLLLGLMLVVQTLAAPATRVAAQTAPAITGTAACNLPPLTVLPGATVTVFSGAAQVFSTLADSSARYTITGAAANSTYSIRYTAASGSPTCDVPVTTDPSGNGTAPPASVCPPGAAGAVTPNTNWLHATTVTLTATGVPATTTITDSLCRFRQSRWYRIPVLPGQRVTAEVTNPSFDATLALFKDISATAQALKPPVGGSLSLDDIQRINAGIPKKLVAPDETSPDETSGDVQLQDVTAPDETSPDETSPDETSPDETSPDFATPDETSPDETSPDETSDLYSVAQTHSILAYSDKPGNASEFVRRHTWDNTGFFYVRVHGHNGAFDDTTPFSLRLTLENRHCLSDGARVALSNPPTSFFFEGSTPRTLILTNTARFPAGSDTAGLMASLRAFAARPEVGGLVLDLAFDRTLQADYAQWDNPSFVDCVPAANIVVDQIHTIEQIVRAGNPSALQGVVLVGNDHVIPFQRIPDEAGLGPEKNYSPAVFDSSASQASLKSDYFLSQDIYGSFRDVSRLDHKLPSFDVPVGRLVENVSDIQAQLAAYVAGGGVIQPTSGLVTGYDFLTPAAILQRDDLIAGTGSASAVDGTLIQPQGDGPGNASAWTAADLRNRLFGTPTRFGIVALNAHFSGNTLLAADEASRTGDINASRVKSRELASVTDGRFINTLFLSMGCHSGYNIVDAEATPGTQPVDWAQAIASQGGTLVGGSGYQYGSTPTIKYSEVLLANLVHELRFFDGPSPGAVSLGQAILNTKRNYVHQDMSGIDEKAVGVLTLYGLPMMGVNLPAGRIARPGAPGLISPIEGTSSGLTRFDLTPAYTLTRHDRVLQEINTDGFTTTTTFFDATIPGGVTDVHAVPGQPIVPQLVTSIAAAGTLARSAILLSANYTDLFSSGSNQFRPLIETPATENRSVRPAYSASIFTPAQLLDLSEFNGQFLAIRPFQFQSNSGDSVFGTGRRYDSLTTRLYYSTRTDSSALNGPPVIYNTRLSTTDAGDLFVDAIVGGPLFAGAPDVEEVLATFTGDACDCASSPFYGRWQSIQLTGGSATTNSIGFIRHYTGTIALGGSSPNLVRVVIQAVGGNGLVSIASNNGSNYRFAAETATLGNPKTATRLRLQPESGSSYAVSYRGTLNVSARITNLNTGAALNNQPLTFTFGRARVHVRSDPSGLASVTLPVLLAPVDFPPPRVTVEREEDQRFLASGDTRDVIINRDPTTLVGTGRSPGYGSAAIVATLLTQLPGGNTPLREIGVRLTLNDGRVLDTITDGLGRVLFDTLDFEGVQPGSYVVTVTFPGNDRYVGSTLNLNQAVTPGTNRSAFFNGVNGFAEAPNSPDLNITGNWTVEAWFKDEDPSGFDHDFREILIKGDRDANPEAPYYILIGHNHLLAGTRSGGIDHPLDANLAFLGLNPTQWHHVAVTFRADLGVLNLWLDGNHISFQDGVPASAGNNLPLEIGRGGRTTGKYWQGKIDDVRIWNIARLGVDISATFRNELTPGPGGLVANWKFNEPIGTFLAFSSVGVHTAILTTTGAGFSTDVHP